MTREYHAEDAGRQKKAHIGMPMTTFKRWGRHRRTSLIRPGSYYYHQGKGQRRRRLSSKSSRTSTDGWHQQSLFRGDENQPVSTYFLPKHPATSYGGILPNFLPRSDVRAPPSAPSPTYVPTNSPPSAIRPRPSRSPTTPQPSLRRVERTSPPSTSPTPIPSPSPTSTPTTGSPTSLSVPTNTPIGTELPTSMPVPPTPVVPNDPVVVPPSQAPTVGSTPTVSPTVLQATGTPTDATASPATSSSDIEVAPSLSPINSIVPVVTTLGPTSTMAASPQQGSTVMPTEQTSSSPPPTSPSQFPSGTLVPTWENFNGTDVPTDAPVTESKERTIVPSTMPSTKPYNSMKLEATDFYLRYVLSDKTPSTQDYEEASATTLDYLDSFMENAFLRNSRIFFEYGDSEVLGTSADPVIIAFSYDFFVEAPNFRPTAEDIDRLVSTALSPPSNQALLNSLSALERKNPFSRTGDIVYSLNLTSLVDSSLPASPESEIPTGVIVMLTMGILLGAAGLGMILLRRRRFRRQRAQPGGACSVDGSELLPPDEAPTALSGGSDPALLSIGSTSLLDLDWSMPGYGTDSFSDSLS